MIYRLNSLGAKLIKTRDKPMDVIKSTPVIANELANQIYIFNKMSSFISTTGDLKRHQLHFLATLARLIKPGEKGIRASDMSRELQITRGGITHILNELEESGLIERITDPSDRRGVLVRLTEKGQKSMEDSYKSAISRLEGLSIFLGESDSQELIRILSRSITYLSNIKKLQQP
jgi:DNA-binding MarR family transcriptional regulator